MYDGFGIIILRHKCMINWKTSLKKNSFHSCESLQQQLEEYHAKLESAKMSDDHIAAELREETKSLQDILKLEQRANQKDK